MGFLFSFTRTLVKFPLQIQFGHLSETIGILIVFVMILLTHILTMQHTPAWSYHDKRFRSVSNTSSGEVSEETTFYYQQNGSVISARYEGGNIREGNLLGEVEPDGTIQMSYQHYNLNNEFRAGVCVSKPEILPDGKIRLHESWEWTSGISGSGQSIIEEI